MNLERLTIYVLAPAISTVLATCLLSLFAMWREQGEHAQKLAAAKEATGATTARVEVLEGSLSEIGRSMGRIEGMLAAADREDDRRRGVR